MVQIIHLLHYYSLMPGGDSKKKNINGTCQSIFHCFIWPKLHDMWKINEWAGHVTGYLSFQEIQWQQRWPEAHLHLQQRYELCRGALPLRLERLIKSRYHFKNGRSQIAILPCLWMYDHPTVPSDLNFNPNTHWNKYMSQDTAHLGSFAHILDLFSISSSRTERATNHDRGLQNISFWEEGFKVIQ